MGTSFGRWMIFIISMLAIGLCDYAKGQNVKITITPLDNAFIVNGQVIDARMISQEGMLEPVVIDEDEYAALSILVRHVCMNDGKTDFMYKSAVTGRERNIECQYEEGKGFKVGSMIDYVNFDPDTLNVSMRLFAERRCGDY